MSARPHQIVVRVTDEANERLRLIAKHYGVPIAEVARGMMEHGYRPWIQKRRGK